VDGKEAEIYITLSFLDVDGKPRYRYAPSQPTPHAVIDRSTPVEILGVVDRSPKNPLNSRK